MIKSDGGSTSYYELPEGAKELQDLIEYRNMSYSLGNVFKACYRLGEKEGADLLYDLNKIVFFANRMIDQEKKRQEGYKVGQVTEDGVLKNIVIAPKEPVPTRAKDKAKSVRDQWRFTEVFNEPLQGNTPDDIAKRERLDKEAQKAWENFWNAAPKSIKPTIRYATKEEQKAAIERVLARHDLSDPRWDDDYKDPSKLVIKPNTYPQYDTSEWSDVSTFKEWADSYRELVRKVAENTSLPTDLKPNPDLDLFAYWDESQMYRTEDTK